MNAGSAGPLRGGKMSTWEGGVRVPLLMQWPNRIPAGRVSSELFSLLDIMPTIASLIGADLSPGNTIDGLDQLPLLTGSGSGTRDHIAYYAIDRLVAFRQGPWKVHLEIPDPNSIGFGTMPAKEPHLYHLEYDPAEQYNYAEGRKRMRAIYDTEAPKIIARAKAFAEQIEHGPSQHDLPSLSPEETAASLDYAQ